MAAMDLHQTNHQVRREQGKRSKIWRIPRGIPSPTARAVPLGVQPAPRQSVHFSLAWEAQRHSVHPRVRREYLEEPSSDSAGRLYKDS